MSATSARAGPRHANHLREHVVAAALDAAEDLLVDRAHDLGGDEPARVGTRQRPRRALKVLARPRDLERQQRAHRSVTTPRRRSSSVQPKRAQILLRQVDAAALQIDADVAHDVGQLQRDARD